MKAKLKKNKKKSSRLNKKLSLTELLLKDAHVQLKMVKQEKSKLEMGTIQSIENAGKKAVECYKTSNAFHDFTLSNFSTLFAS